ncbi:hypothetical protein V1512DRAFT_246737 [Lipomyces arxii]|uniref:uncharacterized protein n=1 Tax=Lipomyces arxii TaxID=56418 RepID=UPI0034CEBC2D
MSISQSCCVGEDVDLWRWNSDLAVSLDVKIAIFAADGFERDFAVTMANLMFPCLSVHIHEYESGTVMDINTISVLPEPILDCFLEFIDVYARGYLVFKIVPPDGYIAAPLYTEQLKPARRRKAISNSYGSDAVLAVVVASTCPEPATVFTITAIEPEYIMKNVLLLPMDVDGIAGCIECNRKYVLCPTFDGQFWISTVHDCPRPWHGQIVVSFDITQSVKTRDTDVFRILSGSSVRIIDLPLAYELLKLVSKLLIADRLSL